MLTRKQHELIRFIQVKLEETGVSPTFEEMKEALDLKSKKLLINPGSLLFKSLMDQAEDVSPFLVKEEAFSDVSTGVDDLAELGVRIAPNPTPDGQLVITGLGPDVVGAEVYDLRGGLVAAHRANSGSTWHLRLPAGPSTYLVSIRTPQRTFVERVVSLR